MPDYKVFEFKCPCGYEVTMVNDKRRFEILRRLHAKKCSSCAGAVFDVNDSVNLDERKDCRGVNLRDMTRKTIGELHTFPVIHRGV